MITKMRINERLKFYSKLKEGASKGAIVPSDPAIKNAKTFAKLLPLDVLVRPHMYVTQEGEIIFYWSDNRNKICVCVRSNGMISYYAIFNNIKKLTAKNLSVTKASLSDLIRAITLLFSEELAVA